MAYYIGENRVTRKFDLFVANEEPTESSHGYKYSYCVGPFRSLKGALVFQALGKSNPNCASVDDAERIAANRFN